MPKPKHKFFPDLADAALSHEAQVLMDAGVDAIQEARDALLVERGRLARKRNEAKPLSRKALVLENAISIVDNRHLALGVYLRLLEISTYIALTAERTAERAATNSTAVEN